MSEEVRKFVRSEVAKILVRSPHKIENTTPLIEYGLDSLQAMDIVLCVEDKYGLEIEDEEVADLRSVDDIVAYVVASTENA